MSRVLGVLVAVLVAGAVAFLAIGGGGATPDVSSATVERLLAAGRTADARSELASVRGSLDPATADYLEGLLLLADGRDADAVVPLARANGARPNDWRTVSALAAATANAGNFAGALALIDAYVAAVPDDERGLAASAQYRLDRRRGTPDGARALADLDRIAALSRRVAREGDPTAVSDPQIRRLRTQAYLAAGRVMDAVLEARKGADETPEDPEAWFLLGEAERRRQRGPDAIDAYRRASRLAPASRRYAEQLALALIAFQGDGGEILRIADALAAQWPGDASLQLLRARALVRVQDPKDPSTDRFTDEAAAIYRELVRREDAPPQVRQDARRNLGVLLYDWGAAGRPGDYLDEAWGLLKEWRRLGGEVDDSLRPTWEDLEERDRKAKEQHR